MPTPEQRAREIQRHQDEKNRIEKAFTARMEKTYEAEGFSASIILIISTCIAVIIVALLMPEPLISKITALLLTLGVGLLSVTLIVYAIARSREAFIDAWHEREEKENAEDVLHQVNLEG